MSGAAYIGATLPIRLDREGLTAALEYLTRLNLAYLRANPGTPPLLRSGVRYGRESGENWLMIPDIIRARRGDCEDLAAWLAAEMRMRGIHARAVPITRTGKFWHVIVEYNGKRFDPSIALGAH